VIASKDSTAQEEETQSDLDMPKMAIMVKREVDVNERLERTAL
jgi:hypothetical protein